MHRSKKKRNIIIFSLIGILMCMTIVYAAFQTKLEIKGTSKVTSNWDIEITNVTNGTPVGEAENAVAPTWTMTTASMEANLYNKGDAMEYDVTIENKGNIDAKLNDILTNVEKENNEAVLITFSGYTKGEILKAGSTKLIHVKIEYNPNYDGEETSSEVEINFDYVQNNNEINNPDNQYLITYDYASNGGSKVDIENEYLTSGSNVNLNNIAYKDGYTFVGWNTDKNAKVGLASYQIKGNVTLYAIYSKTLNITYQKGENIQSISKTNDTCIIYNNETSCEITLPEITSNTGYASDGWYNGDVKVGNPNEKYNIKEDITLISKATEDKIELTISTTPTTNSITVVANATALSGIVKYEYSKDGGQIWEASENNVYVFSNLKTNTNYNIMVRVTSNSGKTATTSKTVTTGSLDITFSSTNKGAATSATYDWAEQKQITINFSQECGSNGITCSYEYNQTTGRYNPLSGTVNVPNGTSASYTFDSIGSLTAKISNGTETKTATYTATKIGNAATTLINNDIVSSGNGLQIDQYEGANLKNRFVYRGFGTGLTNYIQIADSPERLRIVAIESDGTLKLVSDNVFVSNIYWSNSATDEWPNSYINSYINSTYKNHISNNNLLERYFYSNRYWYYGGITYDDNPSQPLTTTIADEKSKSLYNGNSPFGLLGITDYIKASGNSKCTTIQASREGLCTNNWFWKSGVKHTVTMSINNTSGRTNQVIEANSDWVVQGDIGMSSNLKTSSLFTVRPAGYYVSHAKILSGDGTWTTPYIISHY